MDLIQQRIKEANRRYTDATWRLKLENERTSENVKSIISYSRQIQVYQERLRETNEASREKAEKLHLVYKNIELHGQILVIREGLKRAKELTARAEERVENVSKELERMGEERLEIGLEGKETRNKQFSMKITEQLFQDAKYQEFLILKRKLEEANMRLEISGEKLAGLEMRKQDLIQKIDKYKTKKHDILNGKIMKENLHCLHSANLKLYCVEIGAI
ncbi:hypothetical protein ACROYT_G009415 [Oculina patagonica]